MERVQPLSAPLTSVLSSAEVHGLQVDAVGCDEAPLLVYRQPVPPDQDPPRLSSQH